MEERKRQKEFPMKFLKAIAALFISVPLFPFAAALYCYRNNEWIWEHLGS